DANDADPDGPGAASLGGELLPHHPVGLLLARALAHGRGPPSSRRASRENRLPGNQARNPATSNNPMSRTVSVKYAGRTFAAKSPTLPKQPPSTRRPRAPTDPH